MTLINDISAPQLQQILRRISRLENAAPANNAAIGRDGLLVYDGGVITIENGGLDVTGTAKISGTLDVTGTITQTGTSTFTGKTRFTGQTDIWGPLTVTGDTDLDGKISITGTATLKSNLDVTTGKVKVGTMTLDPTVSGLSLIHI